MPGFTSADTIRILVATDNHVGYNERDPVRGDDSWKSFHEVMCLARERDVDMVLLAGDLFHENKPSRKSMYQVMRSLRMNCYGEKPCELEMLSDGSEAFAGAFNHVNYEDLDINVAMPVFSIHGNHDDPSGDGHLAPLDLLQMSGLLNYYGRTPESDNILVKPVLLQKGNTKLALYGMSNVRDERLFQTFRNGGVKFFQPSTQKDDWFNLMSVHQNHHAYTATGFLPEHFLPGFLDLVVWGHEHKCEIEPVTNPVTNFRVMQPGSSVATSLVEGEAEPKHVAIVSVKGKEFEVEPIRLKTVRPFIYKEIALSDDKAMRDIALQADNMTKVHAYLIRTVEELISQANEEWLELQRESGSEPDEDIVPPLPLIRLRVEYTAPEGGEYKMENPQRFSNRFADRVANTADVVSYHRKRAATSRTAKNAPDLPEEDIIEKLTLDNIKVGALVEQFLAAQSLTILPQNFFADVVGQFVDKDDKSALEDFTQQALAGQVRELIAKAEENADEDTIAKLIETIKEEQELAFEKGQLRRKKGKAGIKAKPDGWDSEQDGHWEDNPASIIRDEDDAAEVVDDEEEEEEEESPAPRKTAGRGGRGRGGKATAGTTRKTAAATKKAPAKSTAAKGRKKQVVSEDEDEDDDVVMLDDDDDEEDESQGLFVTQAKTAPSKATRASKALPAKSSNSRTTKTQPAKASTRGGKAAARGGQTQLAFSSQANGAGPARGNPGARIGRAAPPKKLQEPSEDEISDDDAFEPPSTAVSGGGRKR